MQVVRSKEDNREYCENTNKGIFKRFAEIAIILLIPTVLIIGGIFFYRRYVRKKDEDQTIAMQDLLATQHAGQGTGGVIKGYYPDGFFIIPEGPPEYD